MVSETAVYVILVNWNGREITLECLTSLRAAGVHAERTVVVDNASSDGSVEAIVRAFPGVVVLAQAENRRFAGGNNAGMRYALEQGATHLLLLNNDTTVDPGFLTPMMQRMEQDASVGMVAPKIFYHADPERLWFAGGALSMWTGTMRHIGIRELDRGQYDAPRDIEYASGCCVLIRREVVERVGMLDESFFMYAEDADWSMRVRGAGFRIVYEPGARIWHKISVSSGGHLSWFKMKHRFLSNLRFFGRYAAWYQWPVFPWLNIFVNAWAAVRYLLTTR